jgi:hypothetical protein
VGDLPDADIRPPDNVLFVCKLNPHTTDEDLETIFSRFGEIVWCVCGNRDGVLGCVCGEKTVRGGGSQGGCSWAPFLSARAVPLPSLFPPPPFFLMDGTFLLLPPC